MLRSTALKSLADMPIQVPSQNMALLRSLGAAGAPLWDAIESLRSNQTPPQSCPVTGRPGRRELPIRVGLRGFWISWEIEQACGEHIIRVVLIEEK